jgi:hypothetical protein
LAEQAAQDSNRAQGNAADYNNPQQIIGQADQIAQQMISIPYEERKSQLMALQKDDYVMYSVVIQRMEEIKNNMKSTSSQAAKMASLKGGGYPKGMFDTELDMRLERLEKIAEKLTEKLETN